MSWLLPSEFVRGKKISCTECKRIVTLQEQGKLPKGWFALIDSRGSAVTFCSTSCVGHFFNKGQRKATVVKKRDIKW